MSIQTSTEKDTAPGVKPVAPWRIRAVSALPGYRLAVTFQDGKSGIADLSAVMTSQNCGIYAALARPEIFQQVSLELGVVTWPNGADLDPAWMHEQIANGETWSVPI